MEEGSNPAQRVEGMTARPDLAMPFLTDAMIDRLHEYGSEETVAAGTRLFARGDREIDFFIVLDGKIDIIAASKGEQDKLLVEVVNKQFTGELDLLSSNPVIADAVVPAATKLLRVRRVELLRLMRSEADIANLIMQALIWRRIGTLPDGTSGVTLIGKADTSETALLQRFLTLNRYPHRLVAPDEAEPASSSEPRPAAAAVPAVVLPDGRMLHGPTILQLGNELGIGALPDTSTTYDVTIVGAGPAGLSAAVYAASEGLSTLVVEALASGGQAGSSSKIENYLGFPTGISGYELAGRAEMQSRKFGVQFAIPHEVAGIQHGTEQNNGLYLLSLTSGQVVRSRSVIAATGARYRKLSVPDYDRFEGNGVYYAATGLEADLCREREAAVVGGGNSAGQAAIFLSGIASHVHLIIRRDSLESTMSSYLISRIENSTKITIHPFTEVESLHGERAIESLTLVNKQTGERKTQRVTTLFVMIGAEPNSSWLPGSVALDEKGFIATGTGYAQQNSRYATSVPGIFAVGDVRSGSVKRVASAVGEGAVVISDVHEHLASKEETAGSTVSEPSIAAPPHGSAGSRAETSR